MALRVVSFPAMTKRMKKDATSAGESDSPSMLLCTRAEVTSSVGSLRRASARSDMSVVSDCEASISATSGEILRVPRAGDRVARDGDDVGRAQDCAVVGGADAHHAADDLEGEPSGHVH